MATVLDPLSASSSGDLPASKPPDDLVSTDAPMPQIASAESSGQASTGFVHRPESTWTRDQRLILWGMILTLVLGAVGLIATIFQAEIHEYFELRTMDPRSLALLGNCYAQNSHNVNISTLCQAVDASKNEERAVALYRESAEQGDSVGANNLAFHYDRGDLGLPRSPQEAANWYWRSAANGNPSAMFVFGGYKENGTNGVSQDIAEAVRWYRKSASERVPAGRDALDRLSKTIDLSTIADVAPKDPPPAPGTGLLNSITGQVLLWKWLLALSVIFAAAVAIYLVRLRGKSRHSGSALP